MTEFDDLKVSTRTIIASARMELDIGTIFREYPMDEREIPGVFLSSPTKTRIETMYFKNEIRTQEQPVVTHLEGAGKKSFRNALNVIMTIGLLKKINFKVSKNGKFQLTGCKNMIHAKACVFSFLETLRESVPTGYIMTHPPLFRVHFETVMTNVDCSMGYCLNRQALDRVVNTNTLYHSLLETSFGYTGVNIKLPVTMDWKALKIPVLEWTPGQDDTLRQYQQSLKELTASETLSTAPLKKKFNTFLVFHSGKFIMSGMREETMRDDYYRFIRILQDHEDEIKEILLQ
jgi:TATA-box binding protein (TBP) (component of TFIID and TFIIIB)